MKMIMRSLLLLCLCAAVAAAADAYDTLTVDLDDIILQDDPLTSHYGDPATGCEKDEHGFQIQGVKGKVCAPTCTSFKPCPTDLPKGVTAKPVCALRSPSGSTYCALLCQPNSSTNQCGEAKCRSIQGAGICTYGDDDENEGLLRATAM